MQRRQFAIVVLVVGIGAAGYALRRAVNSQVVVQNRSDAQIEELTVVTTEPDGTSGIQTRRGLQPGETMEFTTTAKDLDVSLTFIIDGRTYSGVQHADLWTGECFLILIGTDGGLSSAHGSVAEYEFRRN